MQNSLKLLMVGDISGPLGLQMFKNYLPKVKKMYKIDGVIVNGENAADTGKGITPKIVEELKSQGVNVITSGNHIWAKKEIFSYLKENTDLLRPANYPSGCPGVGVTTFDCAGSLVAVINLQGRVFMREAVDCPLRSVDSILTYLRDKTKIVVVDFHAETTSEKIGLGLYLDGRVSAVVGTHTHVQTADERILKDGTAFITDLGMVGSLNSMIGMKKEPIINNMLTQMPQRFEISLDPPAVFSAACIEVDKATGKAIDIQRVRIVDDTIKPVRL